MPRTMTAGRETELRALGEYKLTCANAVQSALIEMDAERQVSLDLAVALQTLLDVWNSGDATASSKRAQQRRARLMSKCKNALASYEAAS